MSERLTSSFILFGGALVFLLVWYLSVVIVRRDMRRRNASDRERQIWTAAAAVLPLFGFALYLFAYMLRGYFTPAQTADAEEDLLLPPAYPDHDAPGHDVPTPYMPPADRSAVILPATGSSPEARAAREAAPAERPHTEPQEKAALTPATIPAVRRASGAIYALFASKGPHAGQVFELAPLPQRIGRGPEVTIPLDADLNVSRNHAEIYEWMGVLRIRDLGSTHGTLINGVPVTDQSFNLGDHLSVGGTLLVLRELP